MIYSILHLVIVRLAEIADQCSNDHLNFFASLVLDALRHLVAFQFLFNTVKNINNEKKEIREILVGNESDKWKWRWRLQGY